MKAFNPARFGNIITDHSFLASLPKGATRIKSWDNAGMSTKTGEATLALARIEPESLRLLRVHMESVYDTPRRAYVLFAIPFSMDGTTPETRREYVNACRVACFGLLAKKEG